MGNELVHILSSCMIPDVLQSDNGREVSDFSKVWVNLWNSILHFLVYYNFTEDASDLVYVTFFRILQNVFFSSWELVLPS
jgi:hypothetical protein